MKLSYQALFEHTFLFRDSISVFSMEDKCYNSELDKQPFKIKRLV